MPDVQFRVFLYSGANLLTRDNATTCMETTCMTALTQQPGIPSYGMMQASDLVIRAKEVGAMISFRIDLTLDAGVSLLCSYFVET